MEDTPPIQTNWYVITGGPSTGKSKTIDHIAFLGYSIRPEVARIFIDNEMSKGKTLAEIRGNDKNFESEILRIKTEMEERTSPNELIFWERGMPDSIVYLKNCGCDYKIALEASKKRRCKGVFILDILPSYEKDYARTENQKKAKQIHEALHQTYLELGYSVTRVPVATIEERAQFILEKSIGTKTFIGL